MEKVTDEQIKFIAQRLKEGKPLPEEFKWLLFEGKQEAELGYFGKERDIDIITDTMAVPLQRVKAFGKIKDDEWHNMLIFGDNLQVLKELLFWKEAGKLKNPDGSLGVKLVFIDPPFGTGDIYGTGDVGAYSAKLVGAKFLEWLRKRLILLKELLSEDGSIFVRIDYHFGHYVKVLMDEIFKRENFRNEFIVRRGSPKAGLIEQFKEIKSVGVAYDNLYWYSKNPETTFGKILREAEEHQKIGKWSSFKKIYDRPKLRYELLGVNLTKGQWMWNKDRALGAVKNYKRYLKESQKTGETLEEYWKRTGRKLEFIRRHGNSIQYWVKPREFVLTDNNWLDIPGYSHITGYPTENSEQLLERIIRSCSNTNDIVLDAFAGSGTAGSVAEKLGRRWVMIDAGRLAIYTMIKRMLNLKEGIGNTGKPLKPKLFAVYNAGLYDYKMVKELPFEQYRKFALELFQCKDESHEVGKVMLDGYFGLDHVLVFKWKNKEELVVDHEFINELHSLIGDKIGKRFFIIAPWANVAFREDVVQKDDVRYFMLRIPYSVIDELHKKQFTPMGQPIYTTQEVNAVLEQVGFDFINPPTVECEYYIDKPKAGLGRFTGEKEAVIKIKKFYSNVVSKKPISDENRGFKSLSMVMVDMDYNDEWFNFSKWVSSKDLEKNDWEIRLDTKKLGEKIMVVYIDSYGNEKKEVLSLKNFKGSKNRTKKGK